MNKTISIENFLKLIDINKIRFVTLEKKEDIINRESIIFFNFTNYTKYLGSNTHMREIKINDSSEIEILEEGKYQGKNVQILEKFVIEDHPIFEDETQCIEAIKQNWIAFNNIRKRTKKINNEAVKQNWKLLKYVRDIDEKIYKEAIKQNYKALKFIPKEKQTKDLCEKALFKNMNARKYIKISIDS